MYCLPVLYPAMYQRDKKDIRKISKDATSLGLELEYDLDSLVNNQTKSRIMQIYMDDILNTEPPGAKTAFYVICASI